MIGRRSFAVALAAITLISAGARAAQPLTFVGSDTFQTTIVANRVGCPAATSVSTDDIVTGNATLLGSFTTVAGECINLVTLEVAGGFFTTAAADGSTITGNYSGSAQPSGAGSILYAVSGFITGGTGKPAAAELPASERIANAERFFAAAGAVVSHGGNRAFYSPGRDIIQLPEFGQFRDAIAYYGVRGHETVHWTGHGSRCNREFGKRFGDKAYAFEELVAELGAAYLAASLGLTNEPRQDHAAYLQSWLECLRNDRRAIFTAASKAQAAVDYLIGLQPGAVAEAEAFAPRLAA